MVSFICDACQETVRKPKVESHCYKCRECWVLSCVDCGVRFEGEAYASHTSCISEAEKYQGKLYHQFNPKANKNGSTNGNVQDRWVDIVKMVATNTKKFRESGTSDALNGMAEYDNIPRKKKKFENFLKNSLRISNPNVVHEVWELLEAAWNRNKEEIDKQKAETKAVKAKGNIPTSKINRETTNGKSKPKESDSEPEKEENSKKRKLPSSGQNSKGLNGTKKQKSTEEKPAKGWKKLLRRYLKNKKQATFDEIIKEVNVSNNRLMVFLCTLDAKLSIELKGKKCCINLSSVGGNENDEKPAKGWKKVVRKYIKKTEHATLQSIQEALQSSEFSNINNIRLLLFLSTLDARLNINLKGNNCLIVF